MKRKTESDKINRANKTPKSRRSTLVQQRMSWEKFVTDAEDTFTFVQQIHMDYECFLKLLTLLREDLDYHQVEDLPVIDEIRLYGLLSWLATCDYKSFVEECGLDVDSFQEVMTATMDAILECEELEIEFPLMSDQCLAAARGFQSIDDDHPIDTCVCAIDGFFLEFGQGMSIEPSEIKDYYSPDYYNYGINIQAACDHHLRFVYLGVGGPASLCDHEAIRECPLGCLIEALPGNFCAIGDCGYMPTEHLIPLFSHEQSQIPEHKNFNYYADLYRIHIERAFCWMLVRWRVLRVPLRRGPPDKVGRLVECVGRLHNFCLNVCISQNLPTLAEDPSAYWNASEYKMRAVIAESNFMENHCDDCYQVSRNRDRLVALIASKGLVAPEEHICEECARSFMQSCASEESSAGEESLALEESSDDGDDRSAILETLLIE